MSAIELRSVDKVFGTKHALRNVSLTLERGELVCLLGRNGAGKTTAIHTIVGLKHPTNGDVRIDGVSGSSPAVHAVRRGVGYLAEQPVLHDHLTGREFLLFLGELYRVPLTRLTWLDDRIVDLELTEDIDALAKTYSMGTKKKVALLAAFLPDPDIILLDEPTGGVDAAAARVVKDLMREARAGGKLVLFTTHVMEIAESLAERVAILSGGRLIADGPLPSLRQRFGRHHGESLEDLFLRITSAPDADVPRQAAP